MDIGALAPADRNIDGVDGKLTNARWAAMGKCSADTALRDINDLLARGVLRKLEGGGGGAEYGILVGQTGPMLLWSMRKQLSIVEQIYAPSDLQIREP